MIFLRPVLRHVPLTQRFYWNAIESSPNPLKLWKFGRLLIEAALRHKGKPDKRIRMQKPFLMSLFLSFIFAMSAVAEDQKPVVSAKSLKTLREVVRRYQKSAVAEMNVEKKVISEVMGTDRTYNGKLAIAAKRFRFETEVPDRALVIFDGDYLWNIQFPPKGTDAKTQVARAHLDKKNQNQIILSDMLIGQTIMTKFDFLSEKTEGDILKLVAKPKKDDNQMTNLTISVDTKAREISQIDYSDDLGNKTIMKFSDLKLKDKAQPSLFGYKPEKGVEVLNL